MASGVGDDGCGGSSNVSGRQCGRWWCEDSRVGGRWWWSDRCGIGRRAVWEGGVMRMMVWEVV